MGYLIGMNLVCVSCIWSVARREGRYSEAQRDEDYLQVPKCVVFGACFVDVGAVSSISQKFQNFFDMLRSSIWVLMLSRGWGRPRAFDFGREGLQENRESNLF